MIPGTAYLEIALAAWKDYAHPVNTSVIQMKEVYFSTPLIVEYDEEKQVHTIVKPKGDWFEFKIVSQSKSNSDEWLEHAIGELGWSHSNFSKTLTLKELELKCNEQEINIKNEEYKPLKGFAEFDPRWDNLKQIKLGNNQGLAFLELLEPLTAGINFYKFHPVMMDLAVHFILDQIKDENYYLPFSYKRFKVKGFLLKKVYNYINLAELQVQKGIFKFDIIIIDEQGTELVEIEEYTLRKFK